MPNRSERRAEGGNTKGPSDLPGDTTEPFRGTVRTYKGEGVSGPGRSEQKYGGGDDSSEVALGTDHGGLRSIGGADYLIA